MKKISVVASTVMAVGLLAASGVTAFAANTNTTGTLKTNVSAVTTSLEKTKLSSEEMESHMKEKLAQFLADGKITQEQYDQAMSDIAEGKAPEMPGRDKDESGEKNRPEMTEEQKSEMLSKMKEKIAQLLADGKITQEQYDQALNDITEGKIPEISGMGRGGFHGNKTESTTDI